MEWSPSAWAALGRAVKRARLDLGYRSGKAIAERVGLDQNTWYKLERGQEVLDGTLMLVEKALGKPHDWCKEILDSELGGAAASVTAATGDTEKLPEPEGPYLLPPGYKWDDFTREEQLYLRGLMDAMRNRPSE